MDIEGREEPNPSLLKLFKPSHSTEMNMPSIEYNLYYYSQTSHGKEPSVFPGPGLLHNAVEIL